MLNKFLLTFFLICIYSLSYAQDQFSYEVICENLFTRPLWVGPLPESKDLIVVEQAGKIYKFNEAKNTKTLFYDISEKVSRKGNEEGLLGFAFHPKYKTNKTFYIYYSVKKPRKSIIAKVKISGNKKSEKTIMEIDQPWGNHNGGHLEFGPDGYLYIGVGDGGSRADPKGHGQNRGTFLGNILRINVDVKNKKYGIPKDNPFVGKSGIKGEIYAYGLRNPWRFSFDRLTGTLYCGDVGQNKLEEVDIIVKGGNYGWNDMEGTSVFKKSNSKAIKPIAEYPRKLGLSITGGVVYRGKKSSKYYGWYFYGDYVTKKIWALKYVKGKVVDRTLPYRSKWNFSSFGFDHKGNVLICSFGKHNIARLKL
ncbi:MAG: glucose sorbosone dehydrogenase [Planctomycetota bacterium]|nr:MAG: glucose sorbosone dehydrogenase [Planctomycetota bacterium]